MSHSELRYCFYTKLASDKAQISTSSVVKHSSVFHRKDTFACMGNCELFLARLKSFVNTESLLLG